MTDLTPRQEAFVAAFVEADGNVAEASRIAGYTSASSGHEALKSPTVQHAIAKLTRERIHHLAPRMVNILKELALNAKSSFVRLDAAKTLLDRAGFGPIERAELQIDASLTLRIDLSESEVVHPVVIEGGVKNQTDQLVSPSPAREISSKALMQPEGVEVSSASVRRGRGMPMGSVLIEEVKG